MNMKKHYHSKKKNRRAWRNASGVITSMIIDGLLEFHTAQEYQVSYSSGKFIAIIVRSRVTPTAKVHEHYGLKDLRME